MIPRTNVMARVVLEQSSPPNERRMLFSTKKSQVWSFIWMLGLILIYFCLSIGLTFYQRWFVSKFHYPLSVTTCHMLIKFLIAVIYRSLWQCWYRRKRVSLNWPNIFHKIVPTGIFSGIDISFSIWGLQFVTVSLYTMTKSTSIIFILIFSLLFKLERKSWSLVGIVIMISGGLAMFTYKSMQFNLVGFLLILFASLCSGLRWALTQFVMQRSEIGLKNPLDMLYHVQPWMFAASLVFAVIFEGSRVVSNLSELVLPQKMGLVLHNSFLILIGGFIAIALELTEYQVVSTLSSLTLAVAGIVKEIVTLILAVVWTGDEISRINAIGLLMCLGGIVMHVASKANQQGSRVEKMDEASARFLTDDMSSSDEQENDTRDDSSTEVLFSVLNSRDR